MEQTRAWSKVIFPKVLQGEEIYGQSFPDTRAVKGFDKLLLLRDCTIPESAQIFVISTTGTIEHYFVCTRFLVPS